MSYRLIHSSLAILAFTLPVHADSGAETLVFTASRMPLAINATLNDVVVIERQAIDDSMATSLFDLVKGYAGLDMVRKGGPGQEASLYIRGANANHLLILIDGVEVVSATLGLKALADISLDQVERIEIVKGPRAALWGSRALGGVVQIFTRDTDSQSLTLSTGSFNELGLSYSAGAQWQKGRAQFSYDRSHVKGYDARLDGDTDADGASRENFLVKLGYVPGDAKQLNLLLQSSQGSTEFDTSWGGDELEFDNWLWSLDYRQQSEDSEQHWQLSQQRDLSLTLGNGNPPLGFETRTDSIQYQYQQTLSEHWQLGASLQWQNEDIGRSDSSYAQTERDTKSGHLYSHYDQGDWLAEAGARYTDVEGLKNNTSLHLGFGYRITAEQLLSLNLGEGFKAPTFNDLYYPFGGNPDLAYETSENLELIYKSWWTESQLQFSLYRNKVDNLIQWLPDANGIWTPQNVGQAELRGADIEWSYSQQDWQQQIMLSYVDAIDTNTGSALLLRPKTRLNYQLSLDISTNWSLNMAWHYLGKRPDTDYQTFMPIRLKAQHGIDMQLAYKISPVWQLHLGIQDALNQELIYVSGYRPEGRSWRLQLHYRPD